MERCKSKLCPFPHLLHQPRGSLVEQPQHPWDNKIQRVRKTCVKDGENSYRRHECALLFNHTPRSATDGGLHGIFLVQNDRRMVCHPVDRPRSLVSLKLNGDRQGRVARCSRFHGQSPRWEQGACGSRWQFSFLCSAKWDHLGSHSDRTCPMI